MMLRHAYDVASTSCHRTVTVAAAAADAELDGGGDDEDDVEAF